MNLDSFISLPVYFHAAFMLLISLIVFSALRLRELRWAVALLVYLTIGFWYFIDPIYRPDSYALFEVGDFELAFGQVAIFLVVFTGMVAYWLPPIRSDVLQRVDASSLTRSSAVRLVFVCWLILFLIGLSRCDFNVMSALFPIDSRSNWQTMWARPRVGGLFSFLISIADYCYLLVCALFGVILVATNSSQLRSRMIVMVCVSWPMFVLAGDRHRVVAVAFPSILTAIALKRWTNRQRVTFLSLATALIYVVMLCMIEFRNDGLHQVMQDSGFERLRSAQHLGLNMTEELMHINQLQSSDAIAVNWGRNYLVNALNFIPRSIWPSKPLIGEDFSALRVGYNSRGLTAATISFGVIGQGVVNFGAWLGPCAAAFLIAIYARWLCMLPANGSVLRVCLMFVALGKMPELGRDISLLVLWPIVFGALAVWWYESATSQHPYRAICTTPATA